MEHIIEVFTYNLDFAVKRLFHNADMAKTFGLFSELASKSKIRSR